jgi:CelD/BcsL family acetyltransferase involved in cellulose biosynthesis
MTALVSCESQAALVGRVVHDLAGLQALEPAWRDLLGRSSVNGPMLSPAWMLSWWRVFGGLDGRRLAVTVFTEGERLVGLVPLTSHRHWHRPGIPFRRLGPLGTGEAEADAACPEYLCPIAAPGSEEAVAAGLAEMLAAGALGPWDEMVWPSMDAEGPMPALLANALGRAGLEAAIAPADEAPHVPLPATWDAYLNALPSSHRSYLNRSLRAFDRWAGTLGELHCATSRAELAEGFRILTALHGERWREAGRPGAFASPRFRAFHEALLPVLLEEGALELLWLCVRGEPVAAAYNIVWDGKVYFYQGGRKMDVPAGVRPGIVLHALAIRRAIAAGCREYDFLAGAARYKEQFALASRPLVDLRAARPSLRERARRLAEGGIAWARSWIGQRRRRVRPDD